jgi:uncharacterized protein (DUF1778 family)
MRQITLRLSDDLHSLVTESAEAQGQSVNTFATSALLAQVGAKSFSEWREHVAASHRAAGFRGVNDAKASIRHLTGDE